MIVIRSPTELAELVGDQDDREPVGDELLEHAEEVLGLLRGQDGRWLVQHQYPGLAVEGLQDLDPLLFADREATRALGSTLSP